MAVEGLGLSFFALSVWRAARLIGYSAVGVVRPGWRRARPLIRALDSYADQATLAVAVYADPRFRENMRALEDEARRLRRFGRPQVFELPHDFPEGAQEAIWRR